MNKAYGVILESDPAVVVDMRLGKELAPGQTIEVDYDNLRSTLQAVGAPQDNSPLTVALLSEKNNDIGGNRGEYDIADKKISVVVVPERPYGTQNALQHEIQHYVDDLEGYFGEETWLHKRLYDGAMTAHSHEREAEIITAVTPITGAFVSLFELFTSQHAASTSLEWMLPAAAGIGIATFVSVGRSALVSVYNKDPSEVRALRAEETIQLPPTIIVN